MVNVLDIADRSKALEKKYAKYVETEKPKKAKARTGDQFQVEFDEVDQAGQDLLEEAGVVPTLRDRAKVALKNADIRKRKAALNVRIEELNALAKKGKVTKQIVAARRQNIMALQDKIDSIPDGGVNVARKRPGQSPSKGAFGLSNGGKGKEVYIEMGELDGNDYEDTDENRAFRQEFEDRKAKQDEVLDEIEKGVGRLGNIATDMGAELNKQDKIFDQIETQMDQATRSVNTNNQKLKGLLNKMATSRNFCMDMTLIVVLLAVCGYIYSLVS